MDYGSMLGDAFAYAKDAVVGKWKQWALLIVATILLCIPLLGYTLKVFRGEKPAPEVTGWGTLIIDGIKYFIVSIIYAIPSIIVLFATIGAGIIAYVLNPAAILSIAGGVLVGMIIFLLVAIITSLFATIGIIRFARTGSMGEAFNFGGILETIGKIGWGSYILALIVIIIVQVVIALIISLLNVIPALAIIVEIIFIAPIAIFEARYLCQVYDSAGTV